MRHATVIVAAGLALAFGAGSASAALCKPKKGSALIVRSKCKKGELQLAHEQVQAFGLSGAPGRGLLVIDAAGKQVGSSPQVGYYGTTTALRQASSGDWLALALDANGFIEHDVGPGGFIYADAACAGPRLVQFGGYYGMAPNDKALSFSTQIDKKGVAHYARSQDRHGGDFWQITQFYGTTAAAAQQACSSAGGAFVGAPGPCSQGSTNVCQNCCVKIVPQAGTPPVEGAPDLTFDLTPLALAPPFKLQHR